MKKVLVLVLVLAVASMASAGYSNLTLSLTGPSTVAVGTQFIVNVKVTGLEVGNTLGQLQDFSLNVTGVNHTNGVITLASTFNSGLSTITPWTGDKLAFATTAYPGVVENGTVFSFTVTSGAVLGNINYNLSGTEFFAGTQNSDGAYASYGPDYGSITTIGGTTSVIPEPITVALLGLGGLFIRRRKVA